MNCSRISFYQNLIIVSIFSVSIFLMGCGRESSQSGTKDSGLAPTPEISVPQTPTPSPTPTPFVQRAKHGENISPKGAGSNEHDLTIENNSGYDAIAKLVDTKTGKPYRHVYVYQGKTLKLGGLRNGTFELKFALGENYSPETKLFLTSNSFTKFDSLFVFDVEYFPGGYYTDSHRVTLARVKGGNASTSAISEEDF